MYFTYILYSPSTKKFYKGHSHDLRKRIDQHNSGKTKSIKHGIPWRLVYYEKFSKRIEAISREKYFKTASGRRFIKSLNLAPYNPVEVPMPE